MPKEYKILKRVFCDAVTKKEYENFLKLNDQENQVMETLKSFYETLIKDNKELLETLALLEEIIIQIRCKSAIDVKVYITLNKYIYARTIFYRKGNDIYDIRTLIGQTDTYGTDINILYENPEFMGLCKTRLEDLMETEIQKNINDVHKLLYITA